MHGQRLGPGGVWALSPPPRPYLAPSLPLSLQPTLVPTRLEARLGALLSSVPPPGVVTQPGVGQLKFVCRAQALLALPPLFCHYPAATLGLCQSGHRGASGPEKGWRLPPPVGREKGGLPSPESTLGSQTHVRVPARSSLLGLSSVASGDDRVPPSAVFRGNGVA